MYIFQGLSIRKVIFVFCTKIVWYELRGSKAFFFFLNSGRAFKIRAEEQPERQRVWDEEAECQIALQNVRIHVPLMTSYHRQLRGMWRDCSPQCHQQCKLQVASRAPECQAQSDPSTWHAYDMTRKCYHNQSHETRHYSHSHAMPTCRRCSAHVQ